MARILEPFGLRRETFSSLTVINDNPGLRQADLASSIAIDRPHAVLIVNQLIEAGLITSKRSEKDRRAQELNITNKGFLLLENARRAVLAHEASLLEGMNEAEQQEFIRLLNLFEANAISYKEKLYEQRKVSSA